MKKAFISVLYFLIIACVSFFSCGCSQSAQQAAGDAVSGLDEFTLTEEAKNTLKELCACVPDFFGTKSLDTSYIRDFVFSSYSVPDKDPAVISADEAEKRIQLTFGIDYDVSKLVYTDTYSYCYYEDGNIFVQPSSVDKLKYEFDSLSQSGSTYTVTFNMLMGDTQVGTRTITLEQADNENGFIIVGASRKNS